MTDIEIAAECVKLEAWVLAAEENLGKLLREGAAPEAITEVRTVISELRSQQAALSAQITGPVSLEEAALAAQQ